jgi:hypothetical protein
MAVELSVTNLEVASTTVKCKLVNARKEQNSGIQWMSSD